jgi:hypothetical protein
LVEYGENRLGEWQIVRETIMEASENEDLPVDRIAGGGAVEIRLTNLLNGFAE